MSKNNKEKKMKKLSKTHIWPSVLFLILSVFAAGIAFLGFVAVMLFNQTSERFNSACANAVSTLGSLQAVIGNEETAIENLRLYAVAPDTVFIFDEHDQVIAGYGEATYDNNAWGALPQDLFNSLFVDSAMNRYTFCVDESFKHNLLDQTGNLNLINVLLPENFAVFQTSHLESDALLFEARFWLRAAFPDGRSAVMKCSVPLYAKDFMKSFYMGVFAFCIMLLPILFFFINVIVSLLSQRRITKLLYTDTVTGGRSYVYFEHSTAKALSKRSSRQFLIADVTIMKYRSYCNYHGVHAGETLLETVDQEIAACLGKGETCAHSGKSSFALFLKCNDRQQGEARIRTITDILSAKFAKSGIVFHAGIYFQEPAKGLDGKIPDPADCLSRASAARASLSDENVTACAIYDDKLLEEQRWVHKVEEKMQTALDNEEFKVYIQPKYNPVTEELAGGEALIRWINAEDGFISPGRFIPIFENNGFITKIDDYMLSHVARLQAEWLAAGKAVVPVSVNISRAHFANPDLAAHICSLVDAHQVPHHLIEIELTESAFFDDKAALLKTVHNLRELGFEISMDDFGAGYSSLNSLKDLPLDVLKLDAEFFRGENEENRGEIVVSQAIQLAKSLHMRIVAEGVEKKEQVDFLAGQGCDMIQGFYFAKPMPVEEYEQRLH